MDFLPHGRQATCLHLQDTSPRYPTIIFIGSKKKTERTADKAPGAILTHWVVFLRTLDIILEDKGP